MEQQLNDSTFSNCLKQLAVADDDIAEFAKIIYTDPPADDKQAYVEKLMLMFPKPELKPSMRAAAFSIEYNNTNKSKEHYVDFIKASIATYFETNGPSPKQDTRIYSLYSAIVQSSGYGKSRLVFEAAKKDINTIYCNLNKSSDGFPLPTPGLYDFLSSRRNLESMKVFLMHAYRCSYEIINNPVESSDFLPLYAIGGNKSYLTSSFNDFWEHVMKTMPVGREKINDLTNFFKNQQELFLRCYSVKRRNSNGAPEGNLSVDVSNGMANLEGQKFLPELVLVFDEGNTLLEIPENDLDAEQFNLFRLLRKALQELKSYNMMIIFTDTLSSISSFVPPLVRDVSRRLVQTPTTLLPPFYEVTTYDVLADTSFDEKFATLPDCIKILGQGRPLWLATFRTYNQNLDPLKSLIQFAQSKLLCFSQKYLNLPLDTDKYSPNNMAAVAVQAIRYGIEGIMDHTLGTNLMAGHMATGKKIHCIFESFIIFRDVFSRGSHPNGYQVSCRTHSI